MAVSSSKASETPGAGCPLHDWHEDEEDSVPRFFASGSKLPDLGHIGAPSAAQTSQLGNGATGVTSMNSLPGLCRSGTSARSESVTTSSGARGVERRQRLLIPDWNQGSVLTALPRAVAAGNLECPFKTIFGCRVEFNIEDERSWITHSLTHFEKGGKVVQPPKTNKCCFCDKEFLRNTGIESWIARLEHIRQAHHVHGSRLATARPDFELARYLWGAHVIDDALYRHWSATQSNNSPPSSPESPNPGPISYYAESSRVRRGNRR